MATSDAAEQFIILGHGALRLSAQDLRDEVEQTRREMETIIRKNNSQLPRSPMKEAMRRRRRAGKARGRTADTGLWPPPSGCPEWLILLLPLSPKGEKWDVWVQRRKIF